MTHREEATAMLVAMAVDTGGRTINARAGRYVYLYMGVCVRMYE